MTYKGIIFDVFDVIRQDAYQAWLKAHGFTRADPAGQVSVDLDLGRITVVEFTKRLAALSGQTPAEVQAEFLQNEQYNHELIELINKLAARYRLGILSNGNGAYVRQVLKRGKLHERLFHHIAISGELGIKKPSSESFHHILKSMDLPAGQVVFIDDNEHNVAAANTLGITGIQYTDMKRLTTSLTSLGVLPI